MNAFLSHTTFFISGTSSTIAIFLGVSGKKLVCRNHAGSGKARSAARQDITAETPVNFGTNEHPHKAAKILITH